MTTLADRIPSRAFRSTAQAVLLLLLALVFSGCGGVPLAPHRMQGETMGTSFHITALQDLPEEEILALLVRLDKGLFSTYAPESELSRLNRAPANTPIAVSPEMAEVLAIALKVSEDSGGAFDATVGPLVNAWGFGPPGEASPMNEATLQSLRTLVGYEKLVLDTAAKTVTKKEDGLYCDLSAVAKGYAVDAVAGCIEQAGGTDYMVEIGGEVQTRGRNAQGVPWRIGIERPSDGGGMIESVVSLDGAALATSGDYRNFYMAEGKRLSHTIDPRTGRPVTHGLASASVIHPQCAWADAYATTLMVLGPEEGFAWAEARGLAVYLMIRGEDGAFSFRTTAAFEACFE